MCNPCRCAWCETRRYEALSARLQAKARERSERLYAEMVRLIEQLNAEAAR